jgi:hydrogenase maturation protease
MTADEYLSIVVIGVGNEYRHDDAVGIMIARHIKKEAPDSIRVVESDGEPTALMDAWEDADVVIICDATSSNAGAGTVYRFEVSQLRRLAMPRNMFNYSTHGFSVAETIELARALGKTPPRLIVYGIEGQHFSEGSGLTRMVEAAAHDVVRSILSFVRSNRDQGYERSGGGMSEGGRFCTSPLS